MSSLIRNLLLKMPKQKTSMKDKLRNVVKSNNEFIIQDEKLFCKPCGHFINCDDFHLATFVKSHICSKSHKLNKEKKISNQTLEQNLTRKTESEEDIIFKEKLTEAFISANIPLHKLNNPKLKSFLNEYLKKKIPDESTLRKNYVQKIYSKKVSEIKKKFEIRNFT